MTFTNARRSKIGWVNLIDEGAKLPSKSIAQQHLFQAAEHGATFPMAKKVRGSMTHQQLHDFASGPMQGKPAHVGGGGSTGALSRLASKQ